MSDETLRQQRADDLVRAQIALYHTQHKWEPWKALAALVAASAVFMGGVLAVGSWLHPSPQTITVRLEGPLTVKQTKE